MKVRTDVIPQYQQFVGTPESLDYEAICVFAATGFFLDEDTFYKGLRVLKPCREYVLDDERTSILSENQYFKWHYTPKERSFSQVVSEFAYLFETIIEEQTLDKTVILPLSGGLDSRTQAVALKYLNKSVKSYSYAFTNGHDETWYSKKIADICGFFFQDLKVPRGYLWEVIESLAEINNCYSEFTHPRQMAFKESYASMGDVFSLGHWGDVLFDDMGVPNNLSNDGQVAVILKKIIKKGGLELANSLWATWELKGDFESYLKNRIQNILKSIHIPENANAQIRAFKSLYWAPRWTSVNLSVFESVRPIEMPYYDRRMCEFICSVPEEFLAGRKIQIAYIKMRMPSLAKLAWEGHRPFNLYNYHYNKVPWNLPYRIFNRLNRITSSKKYVQRNWELQFLGAGNEQKLQEYIIENIHLNRLIPSDISSDFYKKFNEVDSVYYSHPVSMLLTLSIFSARNKL
ncbi:asparagine synthase [Psychroserpens sp. Hel_I_66]|uniref:asparagine synthase n=1 Tax=Psychroserpens sp. Hel_I_66 TaxID=1250004 RepID=UPI000646B824|nr:asparagine synthase [Psychroserpens sp. Hel_I_66]